MRYLHIETGRRSEDSLTDRIVNAVVGAMLPRANPDIEHLIGEACTWWLEIDETGEPNREIGFSDSGAPIVIGPVGRNHGCLVDASDDWSQSTDDSADAAANFETVWAESALDLPFHSALRLPHSVSYAAAAGERACVIHESGALYPRAPRQLVPQSLR